MLTYSSKVLEILTRVLSILFLLLIVAVCVVINIIAWPNVTRSNTLFQCLNRLVLAVIAVSLVVTHGARERLLRATLLHDLRDSWIWLGCTQMLLGSFLLGYDSSLVSLVQVDSSWTTVLVLAGWLNLVWGGLSIPIGSSLHSRKLEEQFLEANSTNYGEKQREYKSSGMGPWRFPFVSTQRRMSKDNIFRESAHPQSQISHTSSSPVRQSPPQRYAEPSFVEPPVPAVESVQTLSCTPSLTRQQLMSVSTTGSPRVPPRAIPRFQPSYYTSFYTKSGHEQASSNESTTLPRPDTYISNEH